VTIKEGNILFSSGNYMEAIDEYKKIDSDNPLFGQASFNIDYIERNYLNSSFATSIESPTISDSGYSKFLNIFNRPPRSGWSAIITLWKRSEYLEEQLEAIYNQSVRPKEIIIIQNENHFLIDEKIYQKYDLKLIRSDINSLYHRWIISYLSSGEYVCVFDDDVIPGKDWIKLCYRVSQNHNALVGPSGRVARPTSDPAWESVEGHAGEDRICDWVCNSYFFKADWLRHIVAASRYDDHQMTFDDIQLAAALKAVGGIISVVPGQPSDKSDYAGHSKRQYGHDSHALWKRKVESHAHKRSNLIRRLDRIGFKWCGL